jgi:hypothetical protein
MYSLSSISNGCATKTYEAWRRFNPHLLRKILYGRQLCMVSMMIPFIRHRLCHRNCKRSLMSIILDFTSWKSLWTSCLLPDKSIAIENMKFGWRSLFRWAHTLPSGIMRDLMLQVLHLHFSVLELLMRSQTGYRLIRLIIVCIVCKVWFVDVWLRFCTEWLVLYKCMSRNSIHT